MLMNDLVCDLVLKAIQDPPTLAVCARVCRVWHEKAIKLLWCGSVDQASRWRTPDVSTLTTLAANPERFKHYTRHIRDLVVLHGDRQPVNLEPLFQDELWVGFCGRYVVVDIGSDEMTEARMMLFLHARLQILQLFGGHYSNVFFSALSACAPALCWLLVDNRWDTEISSLWRFLQKSRRLKVLILWMGLDNQDITVDSMARLLDMNLDTLELGPCVGISLATVPVFPSTSCNTTRLKLSNVHIDVLFQLPFLFPCLAVLDLDIKQLQGHDTPSFFPATLDRLTACRSLEELNLHLSSHVDVTPPPTTSSSAIVTPPPTFKRLAELTIWSPPRPRPWLAPGTLARIAQSAPTLRVLDIDLYCTPAEGEVSRIAQASPLLRSLSLTAPISPIEALEGCAPSAFAHLEELRIGELLMPSVQGPRPTVHRDDDGNEDVHANLAAGIWDSFHGGKSADDTVAVFIDALDAALTRYAPCLRRFEFSDNSRTGRYILSQLRDRLKMRRGVLSEERIIECEMREKRQIRQMERMMAENE